MRRPPAPEPSICVAPACFAADELPHPRMGRLRPPFTPPLPPRMSAAKGGGPVRLIAIRLVRFQLIPAEHQLNCSLCPTEGFALEYASEYGIDVRWVSDMHFLETVLLCFP